MNNAFRYRIIIISIFLLLLVTFAAVETYALFETNGEAESELDIGQWKIIVNSNDLALTQNITLNNFTYVNGSHTQNGYFAPGSNAYFEIQIDASRSNVSVEYDLSIDDTPIEDYPNIYFSYLNMNTNDSLVDTDYSGIIRLSDANRVVRIRVYITWDNLASYNELDGSLIGSELSFTIDANFRQYTG